MKEYIQGLLADPTFNLGVGLLQASGPRPITSGIGDVLAGGMQFANQRQQQAMQMQAARDKIASRQQVQGLLGGSPQGQLIGSLLGGGYENAASSLMGSMAPQAPNTSSSFNDYITMGGDPNDLQAYSAFKAGLDPNAANEARLLEIELANAEAEREQSQTETRQSRLGQRRTLEGTIKNVTEMIDINNRLKGTVLEPGTPAAELVKTGLSARDAVAQVFGNASKYDNVIADYNTFSKMSKALNLDTFPQLSGIPTSTASLQILSDSQPGTNLDPITNDRVLRSLLGGLFGDADAFSEAYPDYSVKIPEGYRRYLEPKSQSEDGVKEINFEDL